MRADAQLFCRKIFTWEYFNHRCDFRPMESVRGPHIPQSAQTPKRAATDKGILRQARFLFRPHRHGRFLRTSGMDQGDRSDSQIHIHAIGPFFSSQKGRVSILSLAKRSLSQRAGHIAQRKDILEIHRPRWKGHRVETKKKHF